MCISKKNVHSGRSNLLRLDRQGPRLRRDQANYGARILAARRCSPAINHLASRQKAHPFLG
jgi:hypothetical protein